MRVLPFEHVDIDYIRWLSDSSAGIWWKNRQYFNVWTFEKDIAMWSNHFELYQNCSRFYYG